MPFRLSCLRPKVNINVSIPYWCGANRFAAMSLGNYRNGLMLLTNHSRGRKLAAAAEAEAAAAVLAVSNNSDEHKDQQRRLLQNLPPRINWVQAGKVTPIRNQVRASPG